MQCTAKSKRSGERCRNHALKGKDVCRMHQGRPVTHGLYSKYKGQVLGDRIRELLDDTELTNMRPQIATLIALAEDLRDRIERVGGVGQSERQAMAALAVEITKAIERYHKVTEGTRHTIRIEQIQVVVSQIVKVADDTIHSCADRKRFVAGLERLALPGPASVN